MADDTDAKNAARALRGADARAAWSEYLDEKTHLEKKTAKLKAQRLAAEAEAAKSDNDKKAD
jgi:hypothetical protein